MNFSLDRTCFSKYFMIPQLHSSHQNDNSGLWAVESVITCSLASTWSRVAESSALTLACRISIVSWYREEGEKLHTSQCVRTRNTGRSWCHLWSMTQFCGCTKRFKLHIVFHKKKRKSWRLLTIKLAPCTPAFKGPYKTNTRREETFYCHKIKSRWWTTEKSRASF